MSRADEIPHHIQPALRCHLVLALRNERDTMGLDRLGDADQPVASLGADQNPGRNDLSRSWVPGLTGGATRFAISADLR